MWSSSAPMGEEPDPQLDDIIAHLQRRRVRAAPQASVRPPSSACSSIRNAGRPLPATMDTASVRPPSSACSSTRNAGRPLPAAMDTASVRPSSACSSTRNAGRPVPAATDMERRIQEQPEIMELRRQLREANAAQERAQERAQEAERCNSSATQEISKLRREACEATSTTDLMHNEMRELQNRLRAQKVIAESSSTELSFAEEELRQQKCRNSREEAELRSALEASTGRFDMEARAYQQSQQELQSTESETRAAVKKQQSVNDLQQKLLLEEGACRQAQEQEIAAVHEAEEVRSAESNAFDILGPIKDTYDHKVREANAEKDQLRAELQNARKAEDRNRRKADERKHSLAQASEAARQFEQEAQRAEGHAQQWREEAQQTEERLNTWLTQGARVQTTAEAQLTQMQQEFQVSQAKLFLEEGSCQAERDKAASLHEKNCVLERRQKELNDKIQVIQTGLSSLEHREELAMAEAREPLSESPERLSESQKDARKRARPSSCRGGIVQPSRAPAA